jgi:hypothetical protein
MAKMNEQLISHRTRKFSNEEMEMFYEYYNDSAEFHLKQQSPPPPPQPTGNHTNQQKKIKFKIKIRRGTWLEKEIVAKGRLSRSFHYDGFRDGDGPCRYWYEGYKEPRAFVLARMRSQGKI